MYDDRGEKYGCGSPDCTVGCECDRYMEIWNNVFTQFDNDGNGKMCIRDSDKEKYDVRVVIPNYMCMNQEWKEKLEYVAHFYMDIAGQDRYVGVLTVSYTHLYYSGNCS